MIAYSNIYADGDMESISKLSPDEVTILYTDNDNFVATVENGKVTVRLEDTILTDSISFLKISM